MGQAIKDMMDIFISLLDGIISIIQWEGPLAGFFQTMTGGMVQFAMTVGVGKTSIAGFMQLMKLKNKVMGENTVRTKLSSAAQGENTVQTMLNTAQKKQQAAAEAKKAAAESLGTKITQFATAAKAKSTYTTGLKTVALWGQTAATNAATIATKGLSMALSMIPGMGLMLGLSWGLGRLTSWLTRGKDATTEFDEIMGNFELSLDDSAQRTRELKEETIALRDEMRQFKGTGITSIISEDNANTIKDVRNGIQELVGDLQKAQKEFAALTSEERKRTNAVAPVFNAESFYDLQNQIADIAEELDVEVNFVWNTPGELLDIINQLEEAANKQMLIELEANIGTFIELDQNISDQIQLIEGEIESAMNDLVSAIISTGEEIDNANGFVFGESEDAAVASIAEFLEGSQLDDIVDELEGALRTLPSEMRNGMHDWIAVFRNEMDTSDVSMSFAELRNELESVNPEMAELFKNTYSLNKTNDDEQNDFANFFREQNFEQDTADIISAIGSEHADAINNFLRENDASMWTQELLNGLYSTLDIGDLGVRIQDLQQIDTENHREMYNLVQSFMKQQAQMEINSLQQQREEILERTNLGDTLTHEDGRTFNDIEQQIRILENEGATHGTDVSGGINMLREQQAGILETNPHNELSRNHQNIQNAEQNHQAAADALIGDEGGGSSLSDLELQLQTLINEQIGMREHLNSEIIGQMDNMLGSVSNIEDAEERRTALGEKIRNISNGNESVQNMILSNMMQLHNETQRNISALSEYQSLLKGAEGSVSDVQNITSNLVAENENVAVRVAEALGLMEDQAFKLMDIEEKQTHIADLLKEGNLSTEDAETIRLSLLGIIDEELAIEEALAELRSISLEDFIYLSDLKEEDIRRLEFESELLSNRATIDQEREDGLWRMLEMNDLLLELEMESINLQLEGMILDEEELAARLAILEILGWELDENGNLIELHDTQLQQMEEMISSGEIMVTKVGEAGEEMVIFHDSTTNATMAIDQAALATTAVAAGIEIATASAAELAAMMHAAGGAFAAGEAGVAINPSVITPRTRTTNTVANRVAPPSTPRPSTPPRQSTPSGGGRTPSERSPREDRGGREEPVNDSTVDEAVWRFWRLENQIRRVNDEMARLNNEMSELSNQQTRLNNQMSRAQINEDYAQLITLLQQQQQLTNQQIALEERQQGLTRQELDLQTQLRDAHRSHLDDRMAALREYGFQFDETGRLLNYDHARSFVGESAEEVERMLNDWRSTYNTVRDLTNTVDDLNQSLDDSRTSIDGMELSIKEIYEQIRQADISRQLQILETAFRRVELAIQRVNNVLAIQNTAMGLLSGNDFELGMAINHLAIGQASESIRDLAEEFNYLVSNQSEHEEVSEEVLSRLEELKGSMLDNADAVIAYGIALNDLQLARSAADMESFTNAIERNLNRMNALFSNIREGLLSGQSIDDLFADQTVDIEFNRGWNQFLPQFEQRIGMEEKLQNSLDLFAQREIDRTRDVANAQLKIHAEKFNQIIAMQNSETPTITSIFGTEFNSGDWELPGFSDDYEIPEHLQAYFDVFSKQMAELRRLRDEDLEHAGDNMQKRNEILEDFALASMNAQQTLLNQAIAGNNALIDHFQSRIDNAETLGLTGEQIEEYRQRIRDINDANHDYQQQLRDIATATWDFTFERMERVRRQFEILTEVAGHMMSVLNALNNQDPSRNLHVLNMMQLAEIERNRNLRDQRDELLAQREQVDYMSYEWRRINEQVEELNSQLRDSDLSLLEHNQAILENRIRRLFDGIENQMWGRSRAEQERFMAAWITGVEREIELEEMASRIIDLQRDLHEDEMVRLKEQFRLLEEQEKMSRQQMAYMNHHLAIVEAQRRLEEAQNQRNQRHIIETDQGFDWNWQQDDDALEAAEQALRDAERELARMREQAQLDYHQQLREIFDRLESGEIEDEDALRRAIEDLNAQFRGILDDEILDIEGSVEEMIAIADEFLQGRQAILDEIARQELTPQNIGDEVGKAFRDNNKELSRAIANELAGVLDSSIAGFSAATYDASASSKSAISVRSEQSKVEYHIGALEFPNVNSADDIRNAISQLKFAAEQKAGTYSGMNNR